MSRWFRHYAGMSRDEKLVSAAIRSKQSVERVVWIWGALLENAAEVNDGGRFDVDPDELAYFLRCEPADIAAILAALELLGRIIDSKIAKWAERQFESDASRERQKRYRDRKKAGTKREGDVTQTSRDGGVTLQETETETETYTEKEEDEDKAATSAGRHPQAYAFEAGVVRLTEIDLARWVKSFDAINVEAELYSLAEWAGKQKSWYNAVSSALAKKDREARLAKERVRVEATLGAQQAKQKSFLQRGLV